MLESSWYHYLILSWPVTRTSALVLDSHVQLVLQDFQSQEQKHGLWIVQEFTYCPSIRKGFKYVSSNMWSSLANSSNRAVWLLIYRVLFLGNPLGNWVSSSEAKRPLLRKKTSFRLLGLKKNISMNNMLESKNKVAGRLWLKRSCRF